MLIVIALGGSALQRRGEPMTAESLRRNVRIAAESLAPVAREHDLVVGHVPGTPAEARVGCLIEQELGNLLPFERPFATLLTMVEVDARDPAFGNPTTFVGPDYARAEADRLAGDKGWVFRQDGDRWRRVVASPEPRRIVDLRPIKWLLQHHTVVISAGGGAPAVREGGQERHRTDIECVIDKDRASELLARELGADLFVMLTDVGAVCADWGTPAPRAIRRATPEALSNLSFDAGSMGAKVDAACRFVRATGRTAALGDLARLRHLIAGEAGTTIHSSASGIEYA